MARTKPADSNEPAWITRYFNAQARRLHVAAHYGHPVTDCPLCAQAAYVHGSPVISVDAMRAEASRVS